MRQHAAEAALALRLFGPLDVRVNDVPLPHVRSRKVYWLLALLALRHGREVSREWLAGALWPDSELSQGYYNLRQALSELRHALGAAKVRLRSPTPRVLVLDLSDAWFDVARFDEALARGDRASLQEAVSLYRGPLLEGCAEEWIGPERTACEQAYMGALEALATQALENSDLTGAVSFLRQVVSADPFRESAYAALMQALASGGDRAAVTQVYRDMRLLLRRELNADPSPETEALYRRLSTQEVRTLPPSPSAPSPTAPPRHLPIPLSDLIGREEELEEVCGWLGMRRLVTLIGAGGVGKTRLAIEAAATVAERFPEGAWFVDLAPLVDPTFVGQAVAKTLGVQEEPGRSSEEALEQSLQFRSLLLILDNCEHLLEACAVLAKRLLAACPGLRVLATSREALGLTGEQVYRVPSLELPPAGELEKDVGSLLEYAAVRLFVERARQANPVFQLTHRNAGAVANVCLRLDGIPLAIELAAARVRSISIQDINNKLDRRFELLTAGDRTLMPRQKTLRATVDWSYDLLTDPEKRLLRRLSVFDGGCTLEAAEQVCYDEGATGTDIETSNAMDMLGALVDKSLIGAEEEAGTVRYRQLETIRQYSAERLQESGETEQIKDRHRDYYLTLAEQAETQMQGAEQEVWIQRLEVEHDNLRSALAWCVKGKRAGDGKTATEADDLRSAEMGLRLASALWQFWSLRGYWNEGRAHLAEALGREGAAVPSRLRVRALLGACFIAIEQSDYEPARTIIEESLAISRGLGDQHGIAVSLGNLGNLVQSLGDFERARLLREEALAMFRVLEDKRGVADTLCGLARDNYDQGQYGAARELLDEALSIWRAFGNKANIAWLLWHLGVVARMEGSPGTARALFEESLANWRELGNNREGLASCLSELGHVVLRQGDYEQARALLEESVPIFQGLGDKRGYAEALSILGMAAEYTGSYTLAGSLYEHGLRLGRESGHFWPVIFSLQGLGYLAFHQNDFARARALLEESLGISRMINDRWALARSIACLARLAVAEGHMVRGTQLYAANAKLRNPPGFPQPSREREELERDLTVIREALGEGEAADVWAEGMAMTVEQVMAYALEPPERP